MTPQKIFTKTAQFILKQGRPAKMTRPGDQEACVYRTSDGLKCAVGFWMPDDVWCEEINCNNLDYLVCGFDTYPTKAAKKRMTKWVKDFVMPHYDLLLALQAAHDHAMTKKDGAFKKSSITRALKDVAREFKLKAEF